MATFTFTGLSPLDLTVPESFFILYDRLLGGVELPEVLAHAAEVLCKVLLAERATVYVLRSETGELESMATSGNMAQTIRLPVASTSLAGHCARTREPFLVPDAYGDLSSLHPDLRFDSSWDRRLHFRTRDVMCAPVHFKGDLLGVVQVINCGAGKFKPHDLDALASVARVIGYALHHARVYEDLATMKQLEKKKAQFMRVLIHELKSPVAAVTTMLDSWRMMAKSLGGQVPPERTGQIVDRVSARMGGMLVMVQDILQHSAVKAGDALGEVCVIDLAEQVPPVLQGWVPQAQARGLTLRVDVARGPLPVRVDVKAWLLVLSNLLSNALKYTEEGGVFVSLLRVEGAVELRVRDTGIGIPNEDIPKMFGEFFRASNARQKKIEGTGVGLAGVREIVKRFGGDLGLESEIGAGSTFIVRLPLHKG